MASHNRNYPTAVSDFPQDLFDKFLETILDVMDVNELSMQRKVSSPAAEYRKDSEVSGLQSKDPILPPDFKGSSSTV